MKVLVTGAGGQLGLDVVDAYADTDVVALTRADLDVSDEGSVLAAIGDHAPDVVIHTAAWTDVDGCESDADRAHRVNALGAWWVARACDLIGATMVYVSTDYVFDGEPGDEPRPWTEFDPIDPINEYGRSKAAGEQMVRQALREHHIVRTAWVSGARGNNFVKTMLRLARERDSVAVVTDQVGSPTFTRDLAAALREIASSGRHGTWHRTNSGSCSWHELAAATFELAHVDVELQPTTSDAFPRPAARPAWSVLSERHAVSAGLSAMPHWRDGLARLLVELNELDEENRA